MIDLTHPDARQMDNAVTLLEQLIAVLELRATVDPDSPSWIADEEVRRLEDAIMVSLRSMTWSPPGA